MPQNNEQLQHQIDEFLERKTSKYPDINYYAHNG